MNYLYKCRRKNECLLEVKHFTSTEMSQLTVTNNNDLHRIYQVERKI